MRCPVCDAETLVRKEIEENLAVKECSKCGGFWISFADYSNWMKKFRKPLHGNPFYEVSLQTADTRKPRLCPDCGRILMNFKVGHGLDFSLDNCRRCKGVWLDRGEWSILKDRDLFDECHRIFTTSWQDRVHDEEVERLMEKVYVAKFGQAEYQELKRIRKWLYHHPKKSFLLAFLNDPDPYKA